MTKLVGEARRSMKRALAALGLLIMLGLAITAAPLSPVARAEQPTTQGAAQPTVPPQQQTQTQDNSGLSLKTMTVSVMPEYDEPRVLVMYDGAFADTATFPKIVKFRVPKGAEISQVCARPPSGEHNCQLYETTSEGDYTTISYTLPIPTWSIEYYYNPLQGAPDKSMIYDFSTVYPIEKLTVHAQQPLKATNFEVKPAPASVATDNEGFKVSQYSYDNVAKDQKISLDIKYTKTDSSPSVKKQTTQQGGAVSSGGSTNSSIYFMIMGLAGGVILLFAGVWIYNNRQKGPVTRPAMARAASGDKSRPGGRPAGNTLRVPVRASSATGRAEVGNARAEAGSDRAKAAFCSNCGSPLEPDDKFCGVCGTKVKSK